MSILRTTEEPAPEEKPYLERAEMLYNILNDEMKIVIPELLLDKERRDAVILFVARFLGGTVRAEEAE